MKIEDYGKNSAFLSYMIKHIVAYKNKNSPWTEIINRLNQKDNKTTAIVKVSRNCAINKPS